MRSIKKARAFTLLEILIAVAIFAALGTIAALGLRSVLRTHERTKSVDHHLQQLETATTIMRRDINKIINRPVVDSRGKTEAAVASKGRHALSFTRGAYASPFVQSSHNSVQRVSYELKNKQLLRLTWKGANNQKSVVPIKQVVLSNVESLDVEYVDGQGRMMHNWPELGENTLPRAIVMTLSLKGDGQMRLILPVPARGVAKNAHS